MHNISGFFQVSLFCFIVKRNEFGSCLGEVEIKVLKIVGG